MGLSLPHTFSLEGIADGWTKECHLVYESVRYAELKALKEIDTVGIDTESAVDQVINFIEDHFLSGKALSADGIVDLVKADVKELPLETLTNIFNEMNGGKLDPKDTPAVPASEPQPVEQEAPTTTL